MANIRIDLDSPVIDGQSLVFKSPVNCSDITGLIIYFPGGSSTIFDFADAHGNNVGSLNLFSENALVKVLLDTELNRAYVQNADTNAYLEGELSKRLIAIESAEYPGCYYRTVNNRETEWLNPPMKTDIEYRTTERFGGEPVYTMLIGRVFSSSVDNKGNAQPIVSTQEVIINNVVKMWVDSGLYSTDGVTLRDCYGDGSSIMCRHSVNSLRGVITITCNTSGGVAQVRAYILVKYTKPGDRN